MRANKAGALATCYSSLSSKQVPGKGFATFRRMMIELALIRRAVLFFLFFLAPVLAAAQTGVAPRWEIFGGYSYLRLESKSFGFATDYTNMNGWNAAVTFNWRLKWSLTADISGHYGTQLSDLNYMMGPQYNWRRDKSKFFLHGLVGKGQNRVNITVGTQDHFESSGLAFAAGGGFDWDASPRFSLRVVQADYLNTDTFGKNQNDIRVSTGVIFHIGQIGHHPKL